MDVWKWTPKLMLSCLVAVTGGFQYGYHLSELNAPSNAIACEVIDVGYSDTWFDRHGFHQCIKMSTSQVALATALYPIGGLIGSAIASFVSDRYGRKTVSLCNSGVFLVGSLFETFANSMAELYVGRAIVGIAAGITLVNSPLMLNEIAYAEIRGFMGTLNQVFTNCGILFTQFIAIWLAKPHLWRYIFVAGTGIAGFNVLISFLAIETPKWLIKNNQQELAQKNLQYLRHLLKFSENDIKDEMMVWIEEIRGTSSTNQEFALVDNNSELEYNNELYKPKTVSIWTYIKSSEFNRSKMVATIALAAQQLSGIPAIFFYGVAIIHTVLPSKSVVMNCVILILNIVFTVVAAFLIDRVGRKALLLVLNISMLISLILITIGIVKDIPVLTLVMVFVFVSVFALGMGPIPFLISAEVTQLNATTAAQSYGTAMNWIVTVGIGYLFPIAQLKIGGYVFLIFAGCLAVTVLLIWFLFPETKGKKSYNEVWNLVGN